MGDNLETLIIALRNFLLMGTTLFPGGILFYGFSEHNERETTTGIPARKKFKVLWQRSLLHGWEYF